MLDAQHGRTPNADSARLAAALTVQGKAAGLQAIHHVVISDNRERVFAIDTPDVTSVHRRYARVDVMPALQQSMQASTAQMDQLNTQLQRQHAQQPAHALLPDAPMQRAMSR